MEIITGKPVSLTTTDQRPCAGSPPAANAAAQTAPGSPVGPGLEHFLPEPPLSIGYPPPDIEAVHVVDAPPPMFPQATPAGLPQQVPDLDQPGQPRDQLGRWTEL